ncbi:hypothetical protein Efla_000421 [Eimeria flavescens]
MGASSSDPADAARGEAAPTLLRSVAVHGSPEPSTSGGGRTKGGHRSHGFSSSRPGLVRSYSTSDPSNEAFTVTHELDFDDWMSTMIGTAQLILSSSVVALAIYLLFTSPEMTMEGIIYFLCAGFGVFLLLLLATGDSKDPRVRYLGKRQEYVWAFLGLEVCLCLLYCLQTIPTLYGICKFASHKLYLKLTGRDELEFQRGDVPIAYARLSEYDQSLQRMHNPAAIGRTHGASARDSGSIQMREGEQMERSPAEKPLLSDGV